MGESMVEGPNFENKMGESAASGGGLEVSISFGRFENDSLSWEKWSSFSPNKYLEEVEKCSTPGSVAQKKAYFEARYKKIAARKGEFLEEEKSMGTDPLRSDDPKCEDHNENTLGADAEFIISNSQTSAEEVEQDTNSSSVETGTHFDEPKEDAGVALECQSSLVEEAKEEFNGKPDSHEFNDPEEAVLVKEEILLKGSQDTVEQPPKVDIETGNSLGNTEENSKLHTRTISQKITPTKNELILEGTKKKKLVSNIPKSTDISTPRLSKPTSTSTVMNASRSSTKKASVSSSPRSKNPSLAESKRAAPTSLHMSLSLGPANSDSASVNPTRKSLIMERMGDRDIVKRAFKTFQNNYQLKSPSDEKSCGPKQVSIRGSDKKVSASRTSRKENERTRKAADEMNAKRGEWGTRWNSLSSGSPIGTGVGERNTKATSSSIALRSDERAEKRKEFFKKLEEKSYAKETGKTHLSSKSKDVKEAEIRKLRQSLTFKAKPMPDFYRGKGISKHPSEKEGVKNEIHHQPESQRSKFMHHISR